MRFLLLLLWLTAQNPRSIAAAADNEFAEAARTSRDSQGIAMLLMLDGRIVFEDYPNGGAETRATELASGTKSFCGVLELCAVEDGLLQLDEKASETLTEWRTIHVGGTLPFGRF